MLSTAGLPLEPWSDIPRTLLGDLFDRAALRGVRLFLAPTLWPPASEWEAIRAGQEPYVTPELQRDPRRFFAFLDASPDSTDMRVQGRRRIHGGQIARREFPSRYEPFHRSARWHRSPENERVLVEHWMHGPGPPRATVLALHGLGRGEAAANAYGLMARRWFGIGFDVALLTLPFHGGRSPPSAVFSGAPFVSWDAGWLNEAVRQAIQDIHLVQTWLARRSVAPVGLYGVSLGGYLVALLAGLSSWPAFTIPVLPPVCLGTVASQVCGAAAGTSPLSLAEIRLAHRVHSPLTYPLAVPQERVLIIGALGDRVVPPEHARALRQHWGDPAVHWSSGSHTARFRRGRTMDRIAAHLRGLQLLDAEPPVPPRFWARRAT